MNTQEQNILYLGSISSPGFFQWLRRWTEDIASSETNYPIEISLSDYSVFSESPDDREKEVICNILATDITYATICLLAAEYILIVKSPLAQEKNNPKGVRIRAIASLILYIKEVLGNAISLARNGSDLSARILSRSVMEACDLAIIVAWDPKVAGEWISAQDDARDFWHRHLSGKKLSQLRDRYHVAEIPEHEEAFKMYSDFRKEEANIFSMAVHPAYQAGVMTIFQAMQAVPSENKPEGASFEDWYALRTLRNLTLVSSAAARTVITQSITDFEILDSPDLGQEASPSETWRAMLHGVSLAPTLAIGGFESNELEEYLAHFAKATSAI